MSWWWIAIALTGCYRPSETLCTECPDGPVAVDGQGMENADAMKPDTFTAITACSEAAFAAQPDLPIANPGEELTTDGVIAIFDNTDVGNPQTRLREAGLDMPQNSFALVFPNGSGSFTLGHPRLSPDGELLFFLGTNGNGGAEIALLRSTRLPGKMWTTPAAETVTGAMVDLNFRPGVTSNTSPRHMVATASAQPIEGVEDPPNTWTFKALEPFAGFSGPIVQPFLSSDGLALLFIGNPGMNVQVYRATRTSIDLPFTNPVAVHDITNMAGNPEHPAMDPMCTQLFWTNGNSTYKSAGS